MFTIGSNVLQNQVLTPLSHLASQSGILSTPALSVSSTNNLDNRHKHASHNHSTKFTGTSQSPDLLSIISGEHHGSSSATYGNLKTLSKSEKENKVIKFIESWSSVLNHRNVKGINTAVEGNQAVSEWILKNCSPKKSLQGIVEDVARKITAERYPAWRTSYISGQNFLINKHSNLRPQVSPLLNTSIHPTLFNSVNFGFKGLGARGFKTARSIERETIRNSLGRDSTKSKQTIGFTDASPNPTSANANTQNPSDISRLKNLLSKENNVETQQQMKVAFAEGYLAGDGNSDKKPQSRTMRRLKNFQNILGVIVLLAVLASVVNSMGGSLRIKFSNGNEVQPEDITVTFDDVRGVEEAKQELEEIVEFLRNPEKFTGLGAELPKGVLLVGPPGTGKTLLARAVAGEAGVPFFHAAGPEFDELLVGQGARRVRDLFRAAKSRAPCVIFIDEIDSVGAKRSNSVLHPYANQTINQLLAEMDGFHKNEGVIVLGATNRRDDLDKALLRPGRFDVEVQVPIPDLAGRREIFSYYLSKIKIAPEVSMETLARGTTGFTGADIKNVVNQAALRAAADLVDAVSMKHLESARDKVLMGPEKKSRIPDEEVNLVTAYHEGGHTLVSYYTKHSHPLHKVTIIPRGPSLGHTAYIPAKEQYSVTRAQMLAQLDALMGGRAAEELIFGPEMVTSGASSDLKQATSVATTMVKDYGMSDKVGLRTFEDSSGQILSSSDSLSVSTKEAIDAEIKKLLQDSYNRAKTILQAHAKEHKALAEALLKYETLDAADIKAILDGQSMSKDS